MVELTCPAHHPVEGQTPTMPVAITLFVERVLQSQLLDAEQQAELPVLQACAADTRALANELMRRDWLTAYQINQILQGKGAALTLGPFVLLERIGEGGMGQVFKARQKVLNRIVALKVIRQQYLANPKVILRFMREIRAAGQLSHPHIVRAYDADQVNGTYYISMEFIDGVDLAKLVKDNGPLPIDQACEYIRQAALGLQHAFERGMVHRDIKPANLLVTRAVASDRRRSSGLIPRPLNLSVVSSANKTSGVMATLKRSDGALPRAETASYPWGLLKILDMGLARCNDPFTGRAATHLTQLGAVVGTPEYIAPEQARDSHTSDIRADLYSLGCTLYFLLTGQPPFASGTLTEKLMQHQIDTPPSVSETRRDRLLAWQGSAGPVAVPDEMLHVPAPLRELIQRLLAKRPEDRYQTPIELAEALQAIMHSLTDGTLPRTGPVSAPVATVCDSVEIYPGPESAAPTAELAPLVPSAAKPAHANRWKTLIAVTLASLGGLAFVTVATVIGVILSRGGRTQAGIVGTETVAKAGPGDETWRKTLRNAIQKRATWEDARLEMLRFRGSYASSAQAKQIDDLLLKMPTPLDALDRSKFDTPLPKGLPTEVLGSYGFAGAGANKPVASLAVGAHGRWLVTSEDNGIRIFDLLGSSIPHKILAHSARVNQVALAPDGRLLASASDDGTVKVHDVATRHRLQVFDKHKRPVTRLAFHPDGTQIASAGRDGMIRLWDPRTGAESRTIPSADADVRTLAFSNTGREIFWSGAGSEVCWTSVKPGGAIAKFDTNSLAPRVLAFQPHGNLVIVGGGPGPLHVCTIDGTSLALTTTLREQQQVNHVAFAPDGNSFVAVGNGPAVAFWDVQSLKVQKTWNTLRTPGHSAAFAPDGRHLLIGGAQNQVLVARLANHDLEALKKAME